jgi:hypothetical protein
MEDFLERIQLIKQKQVKLPIEKTEFSKILRQNVDEGEIGMFSGMFEAFSSSKNKFKGTVSNNEFEIRKRHVLFQQNQMIARIKGTFRQQNDHLIIDLTINGFSKMILPFYAIAVVFYILFISTMSHGLESFSPFLIIILIHAILMFVVPYFVMRKNVKRTADDIEKELYFMTKKEEFYNL